MTENKKNMDDLTLRSHATLRQLEYLDAIERHGSQRAAARAMRVNESTMRNSLAALNRKAGMRADLEGASSTSTLYGPDGQPMLQWVKKDLKQQSQADALRAAAEALAVDLPRVAPTPAPAASRNDLCTVYTLTDCHVGMFAWAGEGGADWNLEIAERTLIGAFDRLVESSPRSRVGVVAQLGDFLHTDGMLPVTPTNGHVLDAAARYPQMVQVAVALLRHIVARALEYHEVVHVLMAPGNHDLASSVWLRVLFRALYENEPRVKMIDGELPYYALQHGKVMLAWHHGHLKKNEGLPLLFATQYPQMWGSTTRRYCHTGHRHHVEEKEHSGMTVLQHSTLAARDAYAALGGWYSERQATSITYHSDWGQIERHVVTPEMLG